MSIHKRANTDFSSALVFKPNVTDTNSVAEQLAPLIVKEFTAQSARARSNSTPPFTNSTPHINTIILFHEDKILLNNRPHDQLTYVWTSPFGTGSLKSNAGPQSSGRSNVPAERFQGIRITLDLIGQPMIWEVLNDTSGIDIIFVSQTLEGAAITEFGPALQGRRYAIERNLNDTPNTVVARILDDAPLPSGPILYLNARDDDISTVICRCMPSQAHHLAGQVWYQIVTLPEVTMETLRATHRSTNAIPASDLFGRPPLDQRLRLPAVF